MQPARQGFPQNDAADAADILIVTPCLRTRARFAAAATKTGLRVQLVDPAHLPAAGDTGNASGVLVHLPAGCDADEDVLRFAAMMCERKLAVAVLRSDDPSGEARAAPSNLPPSTLRRLQALIDSDRADAANALLTQFALAAGLSTEPAE